MNKNHEQKKHLRTESDKENIQRIFKKSEKALRRLTKLEKKHKKSVDRILSVTGVSERRFLKTGTVFLLLFLCLP